MGSKNLPPNEVEGHECKEPLLWTNAGNRKGLQQRGRRTFQTDPTLHQDLLHPSLGMTRTLRYLQSEGRAIPSDEGVE
jgi:hypothetical protein